MIYFLEDDDNIRKFVCYALAKEGYEVNGFEKPSKFWEELDKNVPKLILLDIMLPEEDGLTILEKLRKNPKYEGIPVIMVTAKSTEFDTVTGLDMGADDYISKPFGMTELTSRVKAVLRRYERTAYNKDVKFNIGNLCVDVSRHTVEADGNEIPLSYKEYMLLITLLEANQRVVTREDLFQRVWGSEYVGESRTLDVHIGKLRSKLGDAGKLICTVKNVGYRLGGEHGE